MIREKEYEWKLRKKSLLHNLLSFGTLVLIGCIPTDENAIDTSETIDQSETDTTAQETTYEETDSVAENETEEDTPPYSVEMANDVEAQYTTEVNQTLLDEHDSLHQAILEDFQEDDYTLENPLVIQDPYGRAPLSGLVLFETDEPMEVTVTVDGQTDDTTLSHTYSGHETEHEVPVLGLYPDMENQVTVTGEKDNGDTVETRLSLSTAPLPADMLEFTVETAQPERMAEGLTFLTPSYYPTAVDHNGDVRWYSPIKTYNHLNRLENGNMLLATLEPYREDYDHLTEMDMLGRVHQSVTIDMVHAAGTPPLHHDTIILPNGNYLALLHDGSAEYVEDEIAELDRETGEVVHRINLKDVFPDMMYEDYTGHSADEGDWAHVNSVWKLKDEEALLLTPRNQDLVFKLSYPEGEVEWLFGYPENWPEELEEYVLEPVGDSFTFHAGPHAVEELPDQDGNEATLDIMLYDNNRVYTRGDEALSEEYSRAVQFRINQDEETVEEIWSYGEERGRAFYSRIVGDADYLPESDHVLINSGHVLNEARNQRASFIVEVTREEEPEIIYELRYGPFGSNEYLQTYRAERMSLYPENE